jgi:hypothetical protein
MRGVLIEVMVEPTTEREGVAPGAVNATELMMMCGTRYIE